MLALEQICAFPVTVTGASPAMGSATTPVVGGFFPTARPSSGSYSEMGLANAGRLDEGPWILAGTRVAAGQFALGADACPSVRSLGQNAAERQGVGAGAKRKNRLLFGSPNHVEFALGLVWPLCANRVFPANWRRRGAKQNLGPEAVYPETPSTKMRGNLLF